MNRFIGSIMTLDSHTIETTLTNIYVRESTFSLSTELLPFISKSKLLLTNVNVNKTSIFFHSIKKITNEIKLFTKAKVWLNKIQTLICIFCFVKYPSKWNYCLNDCHLTPILNNKNKTNTKNYYINSYLRVICINIHHQTVFDARPCQLKLLMVVVSSEVYFATLYWSGDIFLESVCIIAHTFTHNNSNNNNKHYTLLALTS